MPPDRPTAFTAGLPDALTVRAGQTVRLRLTGAMGAGNTWEAVVDSDAVSAGIEIGPPPAAVPGDTVPGDTVPGDTVPGDTVPGDTVRGDTGGRRLPPSSSSATETLVVSGTAPGTARVRLRLARSWAPDPALADHTIIVTVPPPGPSPG